MRVYAVFCLIPFPRFMLSPKERCGCQLHHFIAEPRLRYTYCCALYSPVLTLCIDLSSLPPSAPSLLLSAPPLSTPVFLGIALALSIVFFITFTLVSFRHKMGEKTTAVLDKPIVQSVSAWLGVFGFLVGKERSSRFLRSRAHLLRGIVSFLILRMWFGKAADDFNQSIVLEGSAGPQLSATVGNAFTSTSFLIGVGDRCLYRDTPVVWVAYTFYGVPVVISMAGCSRYSGWPAVTACSWRKDLRSLMSMRSCPVRCSSA